MKYYKTLNKYKASNLEYCVNSKLATSYNWYWLAKEFNGVMVLNIFNYSPTTSRHWWKLRNLFNTLGVHYITIEAPRGLQNLGSAIEYYQERINAIQAKLDNPRSKKTLRHIRLWEIQDCLEKIQVIKSLRAE